ncbi:DNA primase [Quadrisphaera sp. DSM 44207]|uniref:DNA primase n=1 Tax=Quadrisphaera sp. DSM 44207 TaxID=1881057 RepID=UPI000885B3F1|nr:DNA primase [Quadrisphaera sp. DSM 44207]SDQ04558.1 DNA primase [Quadrisphaera sp. DSM 44207]
MAGRIRREDVDLVRERTRIDEVVGEHVTLKSAGVGSLKGLCPFHEERSPSFHVRPGVGMYHCFGCGEGGDVIAFVQKVDALTFVEAVERLAARIGHQLRYEDGAPGRPRQDVGRRQRLLEAHRTAADFYAEQLFAPEAEEGRRFLVERGFDRAAAATFGVGYAPSGWDALTKHLRGRGFTDEEILTGGLASTGSSGRGPYDRFRGRLVWPIRDTTGATIGFGARKLTEDDQGPKYLNTPETPLYRKSQVLYGLDLAKREVARRRQVVVVEGYTDVMACHLAGIGTAVATCGTAFGSEHIAVVRRVMADDDARAGEVVFTFDGDEAGQKAALRAFEEDQRFVAQTFIAVGPDGLDPCELRQRQGDDAVRALVTSRRPLFEFAIRSRLAQFDLGTAEGRVSALRAAAPVVAGIKDRSLRPEYARQLAGWLGMDVETVLRAVASSGRRPASGSTPGRPGAAAGGRGHGTGPASGAADGGARAPQRSAPQGPPRDPVLLAEWQLLQVVLQAPGAVPGEFDALGADAFAAPVHRAVHDAVRAAGGVAAGVAAGAGWAETVHETAAEAVRPLVEALAVAPLPVDGADAVGRLAVDLLRGAMDRDLLRREAELRGRAQRLEGAGDAEAAQRAYAELFALAARRQQMRIDWHGA